MADFIILPEADHAANPNDWSNAILAPGVNSPADVTGLANGTSYVALELLRSPPSTAFMPTGTPNISVTSVGLYADQRSTSTPSFTIDLSGYRAGDRVVLAYGIGSSAQPSTVTVDGDSATFFVSSGGNANSRLHAYVYALPAAGSATTTIQVTIDSNRADNLLAVAVIEDGAIADFGAERQNLGPQPTSVQVTPVNSNNAILAISMGAGDMFGTHSWSGVTEEISADPIGTFNYAGSIALARNVPMASYQVTLTPDSGAASNSDLGLLALAIS